MKSDTKANQSPDIEKQLKNQASQNDSKAAAGGAQAFENKYDWKQGYSLVSRILMMNLLSISLNIKKVLNKGLNIDLVNLQKLNEDEKCENTSQKFLENLERHQAQRPLSPYVVFKSLISVFKVKCFIIIFFSILDSSFEIFNSVALNFCIQSLIDDDKGMAYGWAGIMMGSMFISNLLRCYSWSLGFNMNSQLRAAAINSIYLKISKLSNFAVRSANLGKVINLVSSDMNTTELKFIFLFQMIVGAYTICIALIVLAFRLGPLGMLSIVFLIIILPIQSWIGKVASRYTYRRVQKSDERIKLINEIIEGIRIIKIYGWEEAMRNIINKIRSEEVQQNIKAYAFQFLERAMSSSVVLFSLSLTFIIIYYQGSFSLNLAKIYSTIQTLSYLKINVIQFYGQGFSYIFELQIFLKRFIDIFNIKDIAQQKLESSIENVEKIQPDEIAKFDKFSSFWKAPSFQVKQKTNNQIQSNFNTQPAIQETDSLSAVEEIKPTLKNLSFSIKKGELLAVVGKVGCGKTTLLQIFLNEIPHFKGYYEVQKLNNEGKPLKISYVEQEPYIFSGTVRENILFGSQYEKSWYDYVTQNCCLLQDFNQMDQGDLTIIGERGVNLSGGQKARICLARAVYSNSDLILLDDPLSAVDSKVAKELFYSCIKGVLKEKTVVLVTHQIHFTRGCDRIVILDEKGSLKRIGNFEELHEDLKTLTAGQLKFENVGVSQSQSRNQQEQKQGKPKLAEDSNKAKHEFVDSNQKLQLTKENEEEEEEEEEEEIQLEEKPKQSQQGKPESVNVTAMTYFRYISLINKKFFLFPLWILVFFAAAECAFTTFNRSLSYLSHTSEDSIDKLFGFWIGFSFLYMVLNGIKYMVLSFGIQRGNKSLHISMLQSLVRAPALFFDRTSSGNLMNKFSNDISLLDNLLPFCSCDSIEIFSTFLNLMITCIVFNYYTVIPSVVEAIFLVFFMMYAKDLIVKIRQLDLQQKTPVFSHFSSTLQGVISIKVYGQNNAFIQKMNTLCNNSLRANMTFWLSSRFFGGYIQSIAIICATIGVFIIIAIPDQETSIQAQSITYFMLMIDAIQWCLRQMITTDSVMNSFERSSLLINQPSEAPLTNEQDNIQQTKNIKHQWPAKGEIQFKNVIMKYSKELNPVLKGLNFSVSHGQKIGCVGRTGAGKSSILQALFRLTESESGSEIIVDGVDISKLGLHKLRQNISIIPQIPFVFGGTIRRNLDPLNEYSDEQIWESLKCVELDKYILQKCKDGINTDMTVASSVFSVGQKQLVCLARALLKKNKILVLDEATANVDMETDDFIQKTIRDKFEDCTVLTIAHRLNTIADYDKVIVLSDGLVAEYDTPFSLLSNNENDQTITKNTIFAQMVKNTGKNNSENIFQMAKNKQMQNKQNKN